jgi:hypothetical protein
VVEKGDSTADPTEFFQDQDLIGVAPGEAVRGEDSDDVDFTVTHRVAQGVEPRPVESGTAVSFIAKDVAVVQVVTVGVGPSAQSGELAVDGLLAFLALSGDAGVDSGTHD